MDAFAHKTRRQRCGRAEDHAPGTPVSMDQTAEIHGSFCCSWLFLLRFIAQTAAGAEMYTISARDGHQAEHQHPGREGHPTPRARSLGRSHHHLLFAVRMGGSSVDDRAPVVERQDCCGWLPRDSRSVQIGTRCRGKTYGIRDCEKTDSTSFGGAICNSVSSLNPWLQRCLGPK